MTCQLKTISRTRRQLHLTIAAFCLTTGFVLLAGMRDREPARTKADLARLEQKTATDIQAAEAAAKAHFDQLVDRIHIDPVSAIAVLLRDMRNAPESMPRIAKDMDSMARDMSEMNSKMSAVPLMATEIRRMNGLIGVMAHGVDNTMGRMGN